MRRRIDRLLNGELYCSPSCRQFAQRKVTRPTTELRQLMHDIDTWTALGYLCDVSDNAALGAPKVG